MKKRLASWLKTLIVALLVMPLPVRAEELNSPSLIISEVKVRNDTAGFDEYIEIFNPTTEPVNLNDYFIEYINTPTPLTDQQFIKAVIGDGLLETGQSFILAKNDSDPNLPLAKNSPFSSLADSGGTLRITDTQDKIVDQLSWTSTLSQAIAPIQYICTASNTTCNLTKTQSFSREQSDDGKYLLTNPAWKLSTPSPQSSQLTPLPTAEPEPDPEVPPPNQDTETPADDSGNPQTNSPQ